MSVFSQILFYEIYVKHHYVSGHLWTDLFETWYVAEHYYTLQFDSSLNDLDVYSGTQGYGKGAVILL